MLTWTAPETNGSTITDYEINQWDPGTSLGWHLIGICLTGTIPLLTSFTVEMLDSGVEYFFRIRAVTGDDNVASEWSAAEGSTTDAASAKTLGDTPDAVVLPTVAPSGSAGDVSVMWEKLTGAKTGGSAITEYDIQIWDSANQRWMDEASEAADTGTDAMQTYTDKALPGGSTQYYRVRARNSEGPGPWSAYASNSSPVPARAPDTPVLTATATGTNSVRLTWPMPNANGTELNTFSGYVLTRWNTHLETPGWSGNIGISECRHNAVP